MKVNFMPLRTTLFVAFFSMLTCCYSTAIRAQQNYSITINDVPKQKLLCVGSSAVPLHDNVPAWATEAMADSIYKSLAFKGLRLWIHNEDYKSVNDMLAEFDSWYLQSGILDAAKRRGVEVLLLAPTVGEETPTEPMESYTRRLAEFIKQLRDERGVAINVTGVANEPGFTVVQMTNAVKLLRHELDIRGLSNIGIIAPESSSADEKGASYIRGVKGDASAWNGLQGIASHSYNMAANKEFENSIKGTGKQYWMTEASDNGNEGSNDDTRAATITARFLNDMNHSVDNWFFFIGYKSSTDVTTDNDNATKLIVYDFKSGKLFPHLKYFYFKQIRSVFDYNAVFRDAVSATEGDMVYTYGQKPAINCAAAKNPDGSWAIGAVNLTGINPTFFGEWFYPAATYNVTIHVKELANVPETNFRLFRSSATKQFYNDGIVTMKYGSATVTVSPKEFISLRSVSSSAAKADQTINFSPLTNKVYGDAPFVVNASSSSGLPVSLSVTSGSAIISGNTVTLTGTGTVQISANQQGNENYNEAPTVRQSFSVLANATPVQCSATGSVLYEQWKNVGGNNISDHNYNTEAGSSKLISLFEGPTDVDDNYASRIRGYICPPHTGNYTFWIAGDDATELYVSTTDDPSNKVKIAYSVSWTSAREWNKNSTQKSALVYLEAGKKYYIEALHKEGGGGDNLSVAWQLPSGEMEAPISGSHLSPFQVGVAVAVDQTISFDAIADVTVGAAPFILSASSSSGLPVSFKVVSGPATVTGNMCSVTGAGSVTIEASQSGNASFNAAPLVTKTFNVSAPVLKDQTITFNSIPNVTVGAAPFTLSASSSSGLPVSFKVVNGPATVSGNTCSVSGAGSVTIEASQSGNASFNAAPVVTRTFNVSAPVLKDQTITFNSIEDVTVGAAPFTLSASSSSGLPVSFKVVSGPATVTGNTCSVSGAGSVTIEASQSGNASYNPAPVVTRTFNVSAPVLKDQTITFNSIPDVTVGAAPFTLFASSSSGLPVSFKVVSGPATVTGNTCSVSGAGSVTIEASQSGNTSYNLAPVVTRTFNVSAPVLKDQTISFNSIADVTVGAAPFTLSASSSSGLPLSFKVVSGSATVNGNTCSVTGAGSVTIEASQSGSESYNPAPVVTRTFNVSAPVLKDQTISFNSIPDVTVGAAPFTLSASSSSGLPVSFKVVSGPAAVSGNTCSVSGVGSVTIEASQSGNASYNAAPVVTRMFQVIAYKEPEHNVCSATGTILREQWDNVEGNGLSSNNWNNKPNSASQLSMFEGPTDIGDNYASRIRGYICPPATGNYVFWVAGDNDAELGISTDANPANKTRVAYHSEWTAPREWNKFTSQKSAPIFLEAGKKYYIEAIQKEGAGGDNLAVAWQMPDGMFEGPIAGSHLSPFESSTATPVTAINQSINFAPIADVSVGEAPFVIFATATSGLPVSFKVLSGAATIDRNMVTITNAGTVTIEASQAGNATYNAAPVVTQSFTVLPVNHCSATGYILREYWNNVGGNNIWENNWSKKPDGNNLITSFEGPENIGDNYASRIRGYICAPQDGYYTFWISGDDATELYISSDANPSNKMKVAYNVSWTNPREWNKFETQKSELIYLQAGKKYYAEAIQKEGGGGDNLAVGWQLPNGVSEMPIPGNRLSPYQVSNDEMYSQFSITSSVAQSDAIASATSLAKEITSPLVQVFPNPSTSAAVLTFTPEQSGTASVKLTDLQGRPVINLYNGKVEAGIAKTINFSVAARASGTYIIQIITNNKVVSKKMVVVR